MRLLAALPLLLATIAASTAASTAMAGTFQVPVPQTKAEPSATRGASRAPQGPEPRIEITVPGAGTVDQAKARLRQEAELALCRIKPLRPDDELPYCQP